MRLGGIEAGGTKFVVCIGDESGKILERESIPTTTPDETMRKVIDFFEKKEIEAIGLGCFGPIDLEKESKTYGYITTTPKPGWNQYNIVGTLKKAFPQIAIGFDTDVNAAMLGEHAFGAAKGIDDAVYLTIGTGIGGGILANGKLVHGMMHPEMGHIILKRHENDTFRGKCPFHENCFEGLAAGPAIEERFCCNGSELEDTHLAWKLEAYYIAQALASYIMILSPKKIILGGGVMHQKQLFPMIREQVISLLNGYIKKEQLTKKEIAEYIVEPVLGDNAGISGCLVLAYQAKMYRI